MSPLRQRKLSWWFMNKQPLSPATLSITVLTVSPFSAASLWSLLGVMPLIVTWPVVDTRLACDTMSQILLPIFSTGNFVEQSFVPTCNITSPNESVFILRRDCNISPVLAPQRDTIYNAFGSVQATSRIIESPMRRLGMLGLVWGGWGMGFEVSVDDNDSIWETKVEFLAFKSSTEVDNLVFNSISLDISCCRLIIILVSDATEAGNVRQPGHTHHTMSFPEAVPSLMQASWCQMKHRQHRIISPVPDLPCLHCGVQCRNCSGDGLGTAWASWSPPSAAAAASGDAGELGGSGSASSSLSPGGARYTSGSDGVDSVASVGVETTGPDFMERVLRCNSSLARPASRFSSQEEHSMSSYWRGLTEGHRRLHVIQTGILIFHRVQWVNQSTSMNVCHTFPPTWTGD